MPEEKQGYGDATQTERILALSEEHTLGGFSDKFLKSIIAAYPGTGTQTDQQRLNSAKKALFGVDAKQDKKISTTRLALKFMAWGYIRDRGGPGRSLGCDPYIWLKKKPMGTRSIRELANAAVSEFGEPPIADHLKNEFSKKKIELCISECEGSDIPSSIHMQDLQSLKTRLIQNGIKMEIDEGW